MLLSCHSDTPKGSEKGGTCLGEHNARFRYPPDNKKLTVICVSTSTGSSFRM